MDIQRANDERLEVKCPRYAKEKLHRMRYRRIL
jgi:hypothetical protein